MAAELDPARLRPAGLLHRAIDIRGRSLREPGQHLTGRRFQRIEMRLAIDPFAADEMAKTSVMLGKPSARLGIALGRWTVVHRIEKVGDAHSLSSRMAIEGRVPASDVMFELALDIREQR